MPEFFYHTLTGFNIRYFPGFPKVPRKSKNEQQKILSDQKCFFGK